MAGKYRRDREDMMLAHNICFVPGRKGHDSDVMKRAYVTILKKTRVAFPWSARQRTPTLPRVTYRFCRKLINLMCLQQLDMYNVSTWRDVDVVSYFKCNTVIVFERSFLGKLIKNESIAGPH